MRDAAEYLDTSIPHVRKLILERRIPSYKLGGKVLFDLDELDAFIASELRPAVAS